mgnify:CR=1 FL=1
MGPFCHTESGPDTDCGIPGATTDCASTTRTGGTYYYDNFTFPRHDVDICLVRGGQPEISTDWNWRYRYYIGLPMVDVQSTTKSQVLNRETLYPWPLGIMAFQGEYSTDWHLVLAFITLTIVPVIVMFFAAQRHIVAALRKQFPGDGIIGEESDSGRDLDRLWIDMVRGIGAKGTIASIAVAITRFQSVDCSFMIRPFPFAVRPARSGPAAGPSRSPS